MLILSLSYLLASGASVQKTVPYPIKLIVHES